MVTEQEAAKLRRDMHTELHGTSATLLKCAVGILVVVLLALVSPTLGPERELEAGSGETTQAAAR